MSAPERPELTPDQAVDVRNARAALGASINSAPADYVSHLGSLEYHVQQLLELVDELTGGTAVSDQEDEPEPEEYDPGPEVDDEGGMSEYRYPMAEDYERGQS